MKQDILEKFENHIKRFLTTETSKKVLKDFIIEVYDAGYLQGIKDHTLNGVDRVLG